MKLRANEQRAKRIALKNDAKITSNGVSKPIAAQYLAEILEKKFQKNELNAQIFRSKLPLYLVQAIAYVTSSFDEEGMENVDDATSA